MGAVPGRETLTGTFPIKTVVENERFGGEERGATDTDTDPFVNAVL
jgi:hypothetical protein